MRGGGSAFSIRMMRLDLGAPVRCRDGPAGELADIVVDPRTRRVTNLVVEPHHRHDLARLVPAERAQDHPAQDGSIVLDCTTGELGELEPLRKFAYLPLGEQPETDPGTAVGIEDLSAPPYFQSVGLDGIAGGMQAIDYDPHVALSYDRIPAGSVEIRGTSAVTSSDGDHLGHVVGVVIASGEQIDRLVLGHGHLWGKRKISVPLTAVARILTDEVMLNLSKQEVEDLDDAD